MNAIRVTGMMVAFLFLTLVAVGLRPAVRPHVAHPLNVRETPPGAVMGSFAESGPTVTLPHRPDGGSLRIRLESINGRAAPAAAPRREGNRTVYDRGVAREVYIDRSEGLEQTFEFDAPVSEIGISGRFETEWEPARREGRGVVFRDSTGDVLAYGEAKVVDAEGRSAPVRLSLNGKRWTLDVPSDFLSEARFPVVVDPLIEPISKSEGLATAESFDLDAGLMAFLRAAVAAGTETDDLELLWPTPQGAVRMRGSLARHYSEDARIVVHGTERDEVADAPKDLIFVASAGEGEGRISVAAQVTLEGVQAHLQMGDREYAQEMDFETRRGLFVVQTPVDPGSRQALYCGSPDVLEEECTACEPTAPVPPAPKIAKFKLALVLDYALFAEVKKVTRSADPAVVAFLIQLDMGLVLRRVRNLYWRELGLRFAISGLSLHARPDPYGGSLETFQDEYNNRDGRGVERSVAVLLTGVNPLYWGDRKIGGRAWDIGNVGDPTTAFAISQYYSWSVDDTSQVFAHELGHVLGGMHTFLYKPPIQERSVMSYCIPSDFSFGPRIAEDIRNHNTRILSEQCTGGRTVTGMRTLTTGRLPVGSPLAGVSERSEGRPQIFVLDVPSGTSFLRLQASGGQGNYALAACEHGSPTPSTYEYQGAALYDRQEVHIVNPRGTWYVALYGTGPQTTTPRFSGVTLTATLNDPPRLANVQGEHIRTLKQGMSLYYRIDVDDGGRDLHVSVRGSVPTGFNYFGLEQNLVDLLNLPLFPPFAGSYLPSARGIIPGAPECPWYVRLIANAQVESVYLEALYTPTIFSVAQTLASLSSPCNSLGRHFRILRPTGTYNRLTVVVRGGRGNSFPVLFMNYNPWTDDPMRWDRAAMQGGTMPIGGALLMTIDNPPAESWLTFVGSSSDPLYPPYGDVELTTTWWRQ